MTDQGPEESRTRPEMRVSDDERQRFVNVLRDQTGAGRLTLSEFEDRVGEAFAARTASELERTLRGLPVTPPTVATAPAAAPVERDQLDEVALRRRWRLRLRRDLAGFAVPNFVVNFVWLMGDGGYWWPGWVMMGTGVGLIGTLIHGFDPDEERKKLLTEQREEAMDAIEARHESTGERPD